MQRRKTKTLDAGGWFESRHGEPAFARGKYRELGFRNRTEAEDAFHILDACLADFELALNPRKTTVLELPLPLESTWVIELKRFDLSQGTESGQAGQLTNYFSKAFELHSRNPDEAVLQYAVSRVGSVKVLAGNWSLFQKLLLLCVAPEPASFPHVLGQIITRKNAGAGPILAELEDIANTLIVGHSDLRHSSEVAHALWACLALGLKLGASAVDSVSKCADPVVALLALDCEQHKLVEKPLDKGLWGAQMTTEALYDDQWLLAYEANVKGWLPSVGPADHVAADVNFSFLKANGVSFYDPTRAAPCKRGSTLFSFAEFTTMRGFPASWNKPRILKFLACFLILHCLQEPLTEGRIDTIGLRQRPLAPLFDFFD